jgi:magnesium chelatase family protein
LPTILPGLAPAEALEVTRLHSAAGHATRGRLVTTRPYRAPHHTASTPALVGGGSGRPRPGEVTLAHRGTLFLDELGEFAPTALDALRQPLEERVVRISRHPVSLTFPAAFQLIACSNPCPCGLGEPNCRCTGAARARYLRRMSAPFLDRFDVRVRVTAPEPADMPGEASDVVRARVAAAVDRQQARYADWSWSANAHVPAGVVERLLPLSPDALDAWRSLIEARVLTGRGAARVRRVARTLADLDGVAAITPAHVESAALLRGDVP